MKPVHEKTTTRSTIDDTNNPLLRLPRRTPLRILDVVGPIPEAEEEAHSSSSSSCSRNQAFYALQIQHLSDNPRQFDWFQFQKWKLPSSFQNHRAQVCQYVKELSSSCRQTTTTSIDTLLSPRMIQDECLDMVHRLVKSEHGWVFAEPVDPILLMMPNYFDIVTHPMDLGTIQTKIEGGEYHTIREFYADVHLCFENVILYHGPDEHVSRMAQELKCRFDNEYDVLNLDAGYQRWQDSLVKLLESRQTHNNNNNNNNNNTRAAEPSGEDSSITDAVEAENDDDILSDIHSDNLEKFQTKDTIRRSLLDNG